MKRRFTGIAFLLSVFCFGSLYGQTWQTLPTQGLNSEAVVRVIKKTDMGLTLVTSHGVAISESGMGNDWSFFGDDQSFDLKDIVITPDGKVFGVGIDNRLMQYQEGDGTFDDLSGLLSGEKKKVDMIHLHPVGEGYYLFASGWDSDGIWRSTDGGESWDLYDLAGATTFEEDNVEGLGNWSGSRYIAQEMLTLSDGTLICKYIVGTQVSFDDGDTWYYRKGDYLTASVGGPGSLVQHHYDGTEYVFLASEATSAHYSSLAHAVVNADLGLYWTDIPNSVPRRAGNAKLRLASHSENLLFAHGEGNQIWVTHDNGSIWREAAPAFDANLMGRDMFVIEDSLFLVLPDNQTVVYYDLASPAQWTQTPEMGSISQTSASLNFSSSHFGRVYYVLVPASDNDPSALQIMNGQNSDGLPAGIASSITVGSLDAYSEGIVGLTSNTSYKLCLVHEATNLQVGDVTVLSFSTLADDKAELVSLGVALGELDPGFSPEQVFYSVLLPLGTTSAPGINFQAIASASAEITQPVADLVSEDINDRTAIVTVTAEDDLTTTDYSIEFSVETAVSVGSILNQSLAVSPNPASDRLSVNGVAPGTLVSIYDITGQLLLTSEAGEVNISSLSRGIYLLKVNQKVLRVVVK
jgi:photosystem II stability/assembly factor-like uncharacterized protein